MSKNEIETVGSNIGFGDYTSGDYRVRMDTETTLKQESKMAIVPVKGDFVEVNTNLEPSEGMEFESEEAARVFYSAYAKRVGFRIRISKYSRSRRDNTVISRRFVCSKEGFREVRVKNGSFNERRQHQRAVTRVGCKAMIMVKRLNIGSWVVAKFVKEHNHGPVPPRKVEVRIVHKDENIVEKTITSEEDLFQEPFEGMEFDSEEDAKSFYNAYARHLGFRARISKYCRSRRDNSIISRRIVCSKEGFREIRAKKEISDEGKIKRSRVITRIGCKAMIIVKKMNTGKWVVSRFEKEHNHALITSKKLHLQTQTLTGRSSVSSIQGPRALPSGVVMDDCKSRHQGASQESLTVLYNQLCHEAIRYAQEGAQSEDIYNVAMSAMQEAMEKVAAAKRNAGTAAQSGIQWVTSSQGGDIDFMKPSKPLHDKNSLIEGKQTVTAQELVLLQQPLNFLLVPSELPSDYSPHNFSAEAPADIGIPSSQKQLMPTSPPANGSGKNGLFGQSAKRKRKHQATGADAEYSNSTEKSQRLDFVASTNTNATQSSSSNFITQGTSETQVVTIPALPMALYMPVIGSLPAARSVATPSTMNSYALLAAPIEALPISVCPAETNPQSGPALIPSPAASLANMYVQSKTYTGPNPLVHATAIAAGARIVPPSEAALLIKEVESRIRSGGGAHFKPAIIAGARPLACRAPGLQSCSAETFHKASATQTSRDNHAQVINPELREPHSHGQLADSPGLGDNHYTADTLTSSR